ncbi:MAG TPA: hypothetical protein VN345_09520 [Blastocatellia bacterium]|jgi:hypothetical protein|nr:hypothetical protein [Blastocatellia bacterium]
MSTSFAEIVEEVKTLSSQEKQELHQLIEKYLAEERREEIYQNCVQAFSELAEGQAEFTSDMDKLKEQLLND